jgi:hypothetical protein
MKLFDCPDKTKPGRVHVTIDSKDYERMARALIEREVCHSWLADAGFSGDFMVTSSKIGVADQG